MLLRLLTRIYVINALNKAHSPLNKIQYKFFVCLQLVIKSDNNKVKSVIASC